jgi:hypothetical protein
MALHREFTKETAIPVYFCLPHSPWERGSNENMNGVLRQYFPKSANLAVDAPWVWRRSLRRSMNALARHSIWKRRQDALLYLRKRPIGRHCCDDQESPPWQKTGPGGPIKMAVDICLIVFRSVGSVAQRETRRRTVYLMQLRI